MLSNRRLPVSLKDLRGGVFFMAVMQKSPTQVENVGNSTYYLIERFKL